MSMKKLGNKGFSLVELMVIIGIMSILTGIFTFGFSLISNKQVDQCAKKIQMSLENARTTSMGKKYVDLHFYYSGGKIYVEKRIDMSGSTAITEMGDGSLTVKYVLKDASGAQTSTTLQSADLYNVCFDRASGSLKPISGNTYLDHFEVSNGRKTLKVKIEKLTGRVTIE